MKKRGGDGNREIEGEGERGTGESLPNPNPVRHPRIFGSISALKKSSSIPPGTATADLSFPFADLPFLPQSRPVNS